MNNISKFLVMLRNDVYKVLPMRESTDKGKDNHLADYLLSLVINAKGAVATYPVLSNEKTYIYVVNNLNYLQQNPMVVFETLRKTILNCTKSLNDLSIKYKEGGEALNG